ncbi:hypothetical protein Tco_1225016 [Tanacetum coccineum]
MVGQYMQKKEEDRRIAEDQAAKDQYWKIPICYDDDEDYTIEITPVLSTKEAVDSLIMEYDHLDTISAMESDEVVENVTPKDGEIEDDILREKLLNVNLLIAKIDALKDNPIPSSEFTFCFDLEEISSGGTTTRSDLSLLDYEVFNLDDYHIKENSSGSIITHADFSLAKYDSFIFDLSINPFLPADRSDFYHEEFADELAHIISPSEYDYFYFKSEPDPGELTSIVDFGIRENILSTTNVNLPFEDAQSPLLAFVVWIFLPFLTYPVTPPYLFCCGNEDIIFDPGISVYYSFMPSVSHQSGTFMKFNVYPNDLNESPMEILSSTCTKTSASREAACVFSSFYFLD